MTVPLSATDSRSSLVRKFVMDGRVNTRRPCGAPDIAYHTPCQQPTIAPPALFQDLNRHNRHPFRPGHPARLPSGVGGALAGDGCARLARPPTQLRLARAGRRRGRGGHIFRHKRRRWSLRYITSFEVERRSCAKGARAVRNAVQSPHGVSQSHVATPAHAPESGWSGQGTHVFCSVALPSAFRTLSLAPMKRRHAAARAATTIKRRKHRV